MIALCTAAWLSALAGVTVTVAPDQPLPHIYIDEPLILELVAEESITVSGEVRVHNDDGFVQSLPLESRRLPGGAARWIALGGIPVERGNYRLEIILTDEEDGRWVRQVDCCFIERPPSSAFPRIVVDADGADAARLELAARAAGVGTVRLNFRSANFDALLEHLLHAGVRVVVAAAPADAEALVARIGAFERVQRDLVQRCELAFEGNTEAWYAAAALIRQGISGLDAIPVLREVDELELLLEHGTGLLRQAVSGVEDAVALRSAAQRQGIEHLMLFRGPSTPAPAEPGEIAGWLQGVLTAWSAGYSQLAVSGDHLLNGDALGKPYPYLAMMAHRLTDYRFMGRLPTDAEDATVLVFRRGAAWLVAAWSETEQTLPLPLGPSQRLAAFDARGNSFSPGSLVDGELSITLDAMPRFWTGQDGHLFGRVAQPQALAAGTALLAHPEADELLHPDIVEMVTGFLADPDESVSRRHFFTMLQGFPELEAMWHTGRQPVDTVVPLVASMAEFMRALCVLEENHGEQFLEPLSDTLAQCSEYQALYVTGSTGQGIAHDRGDWLLRDIDRLTAEARLLAEHGRSIEANAVANLAEWRARSLGAITQSVSEAR